MMRIFATAVFAFAAALTHSGLAQAQSEPYPARPIHVYVGFAAGGGNDLFARLVAPQFEKAIGATVIIENKPGAGGRLAAEQVSRAPADGYTLMVAASGAMSIAAASLPNLSYHPTRSFVPLNMIASFPLVLVVPADHQVKTVKELIEFAKANPAKANYATSSPAFTVASELLKLKTGMPAQPIPYKSSNESNLSVVSGQTLFTISDGPPAIPLVKGGKLRALAVTGSERSPELPDVPSMGEAGLPAVNSQLWSGFFAPAATPAPVVAKLRAALTQALADPGVQEKLRGMAVKPGGPVGDAFGKWVDDDVKAISEIVKAADLKFDQ
ncbi:MAG: tripartite tricarboxylate transporter substrate binding protein [Pseudolabrys sp.]|nr:tripartite tricarboxylate transporter substrate binding protein [Pseudolabrys sp.]